MGYAVIWELDTEFDAQVRRIWQALADAGITDSQLALNMMPHVSLAICQNLDPEKFEAEVRDFAERCPAFTLSFPNIGVFPNNPGVLYLGAVATRPIIHTHTQFHSKFMAYAEQPIQHYMPGNWVPHCTLADGVPHARLSDALQIALQTPLPLTARVTHATLVEFVPVVTKYRYPIGASA